MAISAYTGPPGAGKSYAMVEQVIVPAYRSGRRVLTNIDGVNPEAIRSYALERGDDPDALGEIVLFHGDQAKEDAFWPTEATGDAETFVKGGDLLVFDEWRLYFPRRGKMPTERVEAFLRWHRHLTCEIGGKSVACDVVIGTQLLSDLNDSFRGLTENSYKFKKLKSVGLSKAFVWDSYDGHLQPKGDRVKTGNGTYKPEIFALYSSYSGGKGATELATDARRSVIGKWLYYALGVGVVAAGWAIYTVVGFFNGAGVVEAAEVAPGGAPGAVPGAAVVGGPVQPAHRAASSTWRIVGQMEGNGGTRVVVMSSGGALRFLPPQGFTFDEGRAVEGMVDGERVLAEDRVSVDAAPGGAFTLPTPGAGL